jgi:hypothetical protein
VAPPAFNSAAFLAGRPLGVADSVARWRCVADSVARWRCVADSVAQLRKIERGADPNRAAPHNMEDTLTRTASQRGVAGKQRRLSATASDPAGAPADSVQLLATYLRVSALVRGDLDWSVADAEAAVADARGTNKNNPLLRPLTRAIADMRAKRVQYAEVEANLIARRNTASAQRDMRIFVRQVAAATHLRDKPEFAFLREGLALE